MENVNHQILEAVKSNDVGRVIGLIDNGVDIDTIDEQGNTILILSSKLSDLNTVKFLLNRCHNTEETNNTGNTPLISRGK